MFEIRCHRDKGWQKRYGRDYVDTPLRIPVSRCYTGRFVLDLNNQSFRVVVIYEELISADPIRGVIHDKNELIPEI